MEEIKKTKSRDSKFEILRIIAMLLIVSHHFAIYGFQLNNITYNYNKIIVDILSLGGKLGVNLFILISAYFLIDLEFKPKRLIKIVCETWFYSIFMLILFKICLNPIKSISIKQLLKCIFPISFGLYWFVTDYIILMLFSPFLNYLINKFEPKILKRMIIFLSIIFVYIGTVPFVFKDIYNVLFWFILLYLIVGYIKKYVNLARINLKFNLLIGIISYLLIIFICIFLNIVGHKLNDNNMLLSNSTYFLKENSIFIFISSIELFLVFIKLPKFSCNLINKIASCTFGVYLIHENIFMRDYLWQVILKTQEHYYSYNLVLYSIMIIFVVYIVCTIIDLLRQIIIEKIYLKIANILYDKISVMIIKFNNHMKI